MDKSDRLALLVVASWVLGRPSPDADLPTDRRLLDRALQRAVEHGAFTDEGLEFVNTGVALVCVQAESILDEARAAGLTSTSNPSYIHSATKITPRGARHLLSDVGVAEDVGQAWGRTLSEAVDLVRREFAERRAAV